MSGSSLVLPDGWEVLADPGPQGVLAAREPDDGTDRFRTNVVVTAGATGDLPFAEWQAGTDRLLPGALDDYLLVDLERLSIHDAPGVRRLAHHRSPGGAAVTMEQWCVLVAGVGHTLTATVETWRYDEEADRLGALAASWRVPGPTS